MMLCSFEEKLTNDADISIRTPHTNWSKTCMPEGVCDSSPPLASCNLALEKPDSTESDSKVSPSLTAKYTATDLNDSVWHFRLLAYAGSGVRGGCKMTCIP